MGETGPGPNVPTDATILVIEEDDVLAQQYVDWLADRWDVTAVAGGSQALAAIETEPDVVVLRRRLSSIHGDRLLGIINERDLRSRVTMITTVDPGPAAVRLGFDDHLVDPVTEDALVASVEELLLRGVYEHLVARFYGQASRKATFEGEHPEHILADHEEYQTVRENLRKTRREVDEVLAAFRDHHVYSRLCDELSRRPSGADADESLPEP